MPYKSFDREELYRLLWNDADRHGFLKRNQKDLAKEVGLSYQRLSEIMDEFIALGRVKKIGRRFQLRSPDSFTWGSDYDAASYKYRHEYRGRR